MRSGYSSLNLIHRLRPDFIKLDTQLVRGGHDDPYKAVITQKVLEIAQSLNIETIVEGVEPARSWAGRGSKARDLTRRVSWSPDPPVLL